MFHCKSLSGRFIRITPVSLPLSVCLILMQVIAAPVLNAGGTIEVKKTYHLKGLLSLPESEERVPHTIQEQEKEKIILEIREELIHYLYEENDTQNLNPASPEGLSSQEMIPNEPIRTVNCHVTLTRPPRPDTPEQRAAGMPFAESLSREILSEPEDLRKYLTRIITYQINDVFNHFTDPCRLFVHYDIIFQLSRLPGNRFTFLCRTKARHNLDETKALQTPNYFTWLLSPIMPVLAWLGLRRGSGGEK